MEAITVLIAGPLCLLVLAAIIYIWYLVCHEFARIAADKGYPDNRYFHYCFWLGIIGMLMVIALPDRMGTADAPGPKHSDEPAPVPVTHNDLRNAVSADINKATAAVSSATAQAVAAAQSAAATRAAAAAGASVPEPDPSSVPSANDWRCTCGTGNSSRVTLCIGCRAKWHCSCGNLNDRAAHKCAKCGAWHCTCGATNPASKGTCESCGETKPR